MYHCQYPFVPVPCPKNGQAPSAWASGRPFLVKETSFQGLGLSWLDWIRNWLCMPNSTLRLHQTGSQNLHPITVEFNALGLCKASSWNTRPTARPRRYMHGVFAQGWRRGRQFKLRTEGPRMNSAEIPRDAQGQAHAWLAQYILRYPELRAFRAYS